MNNIGEGIPCASAPSSPGRFPGGFFFSAPTSPVRSPSRAQAEQYLKKEGDSASPGGSGSDFEFSARFSEFDGGAVSADELFFNGQIRPMIPLDKPQVLRPLIDLEEPEVCGEFSAPQTEGYMEEEGSRGRELSRDKSRQRRTRSMSPLRSALKWEAPQEPEPSKLEEEDEFKASPVKKGKSGSKRWISLKDFLYRSKSEGSGHTSERHWMPLSSSSSPAKQHSSSSKKEASLAEKSKAKHKNAVPVSNSQGTRNMNGHGARRVPVSAHELHYTANRAQAEELRHKTYLPYRQGLFGFLGFTSRNYTVTRTLHPTLT